jgi:microcystin-dependent protein
MTKLRKSHLLLTTAALAGGLGMASAVSAQDNYIGEILKVPYNFCPAGTDEADGQLLSIAQYNALYALYGTTFGGDGQNTFALPNMQSRISIHNGTGPGLTPRTLGQVGGTETNTQTLATMPRHEHIALVRTTSAAANATSPAGNKLGTTPAAKYSATAPLAQLINRESVLINNAGSGQPYSHLPPTLAIRYCVVLEGIFPSRN